MPGLELGAGHAAVSKGWGGVRPPLLGAPRLMKNSDKPMGDSNSIQ